MSMFIAIEPKNTDLHFKSTFSMFCANLQKKYFKHRSSFILKLYVNLIHKLCVVKHAHMLGHFNTGPVKKL